MHDGLERQHHCINRPPLGVLYSSRSMPVSDRHTRSLLLLAAVVVDAFRARAFSSDDRPRFRSAVVRRITHPPPG